MASLKRFNTFGVAAEAQQIVEFNSIRDLEELRAKGVFQSHHLILGGGSNVLFRDHFPGVVLVNRMTGISVSNETDDGIHLVVSGGTAWHDTVTFAVEHGWGGIENMALIPGSTGAAPMQNIGAYGREIKDCFVSLQAYHKATGEIHQFDAEACAFGYRESVFKREKAGLYIILEVTLQLSKKPVLNTSYGAIEDMHREMNIANPTLRSVYDAVISIRQSKLPDPAELGNAGSFFKNPVIPKSDFEALQERYPKLPHFPQSDGTVKVPAGWLIDTAGWKGFRKGAVGVHAKQALVLVNYGGATGSELFEFAQTIQNDIRQRFGILLEMEVNIIPPVQG